MLLGSGTSVGVPFIGCRCAVCTNGNPRNHRLRCSVLIRAGEQRVLLDCGPDFRQQALAYGIDRLDGVAISHPHADHLFGLDDLRLLILHQRRPMPVYGTEPVLDTIRRVYAYAFTEPEHGTFVPRMELTAIGDPHAPFCIGDTVIQPFEVVHSNVTTLGFRIGGFAYIPDCKSVPPRAREILAGLDDLVIDGLRRQPHPTHQNLDEALAEVAVLRPRRAWLTHLTHDFDDATDNEGLPAGVRLAYDGLVVPIDAAR